MFKGATIGIGVGVRLGGGAKAGAPVPPLLDRLSVSATSAVSTFRQLKAAYSSGTFLTSTGGKITGLKDQSGNTRDYAQATDANRPLLDLWGGKSVPSILLDTVAKNLQGALLSALITTTTGTIVALAQVGPAANALSGSPESGGGVVADTAQGGSIWAGPGGMMGQGYDGNYFRTPQLNFVPDQPCIMVWQHGAGTMYIKDGTGAVQSVALGAITYAAFNILIGTADGKSLLGHVFEVLTFATMIGAPDLALILADMNNWITAQHMNISGFPSAANTGTTGALAPSAGDRTITVDGTVVQNLDITGRITVTANNVVIKNCRVANDGDYCILMTDGQTGLVVQDCEILASGTTDVTGIHGDGLFQRNNIHNVENGIVFSTNGSALNNYIHDLASSVTGHLDGIECNGAQNGVLIQGNTILNPQNQTSAVQLNNGFGALANVTVDSNYIGGGGYTAYVDNTQGVGAVSGIIFSNNVMERGSFGYFSTYTSPVAFANNRNVRTGELSIANAGWIAHSAAEDNTWVDIAYGNGVFVAIASDGTHRVMTSPDGITWTAQTASIVETWSAITFGNGLFVAVCSNASQGMSSPDGVTWTTFNGAAPSNWIDVAYGAGVFAAVGRIGSKRVETSPDGVTWTGQNSAAQNTWGKVVFGNGLFVAVTFVGAAANDAMTSADGATWVAHSTGLNADRTAIAYGNGVYVALSPANATQVTSSPDGATWTGRTSAEANTWNGLAYDGALFVAVASSGPNRIMTSPDGTTWTAVAAPEANAWNAIAVGGGLRVAVAGSGTHRVMVSPIS